MTAKSWVYGRFLCNWDNIMHELMLKKRPHKGRSRKEIREQLALDQVVVTEEQLPSGWSKNALSLVNKLILRKPESKYS